MNHFWRLLVAASLGVLAVPALAAPLEKAERMFLLQGLCSQDQVVALNRLVEVGAGEERAWSTQIIEALRGGSYICSPTRGPLVSGGDAALDAVTLAPAAGVASPEEAPLVPTIVLRRALTIAAAQLDLFSPDLKIRTAAAAQVNDSFAHLNPAVVESALVAEADVEIRAALAMALAKRGLQSEAPSQRLKAIAAVAQVPSEAGRTLLMNYLQTNTDTLDVETGYPLSSLWFRPADLVGSTTSL